MENCFADADIPLRRGAEVVMAKRKTGHQLRVEQFMNTIIEKAELAPMPSVPTIPDDKIILSRARIVLEETLELLEAMGVTIETVFGETVTRQNVVLTKTYTHDLPHIAKEIADLSVVTIGTFSAFGIADVAVLEEVDANNLAKFGPGGYLDENRKWRKPPNHPTPDIAKVLYDQGWGENTEDSHEAGKAAGVPV